MRNPFILENYGVELPEPIVTAFEKAAEVTDEKPPREPAPLSWRATDKEFQKYLVEQARYEAYRRVSDTEARRRIAAQNSAERVVIKHWPALIQACVPALNAMIEKRDFRAESVARFDALMGHLRKLMESELAKGGGIPFADCEIQPLAMNRGRLYGKLRAVRLSDLHSPTLWFSEPPAGISVGNPPAYTDAIAADSPIAVGDVRELASDLAIARARALIDSAKSFASVDWGDHEKAISAASRGDFMPLSAATAGAAVNI